MPFPFLRLPELVQFEVLSKLHLFDIFYFSLLSSKTKSIVKLSNTKVGLTWQLCSDGFENRIILENEKKERIELAVFVGRSHGVSSKRIHFEQEVVTVRRKGSCLRFGNYEATTAERKRLFEKLNVYILDIFKVKHYHLEGDIFLLKDFVSKYTKKLVKLTIEDKDVRMELPNALEEFSVEELEIERSRPLCRNGLEFSAPVKVRVLTCYALNWLTMEAFWNLDCEELVLDFFCSFSTRFFMSEELELDQLNDIIKRWIAGGWKNLKEFVIKFGFVDRDYHISITIYQASIMNGIQTERINENSFRVQRENGTTAIVTVMKDAFMMTIEE